jgi:hypothetical protein
MLTKCFAVEHPDQCIHIAIHPGRTHTFAETLRDVMLTSMYVGWVQTDMGSAKGRTPPVTPEQVLHPLIHTFF